MNNYVKIAILVVVAGLAIYLLPHKAQSPQNTDDNNDGQQVAVTDFASCVSAGFPILESFPEQCIGPEGKFYVNESSAAAEVVIESPKSGDLVASPLVIKGRARGNWFFEANIPVTLKDQNGKTLAQKGFMATEDWMTTNFVNFQGTLEFTSPTTEFGILIIAKDNPSGLPENDKEFAIPVRFR